MILPSSVRHRPQLRDGSAVQSVPTWFFLFICQFFFVSLFRKSVFLIINDGCGLKYKGYFYWPSLPNRKTTGQLISSSSSTYTITELSKFSWFISSLKLFWYPHHSFSPEHGQFCSQPAETQENEFLKGFFIHISSLSTISLLCSKFSVKNFFRHQQFFHQWIYVTWL